MEKAQGMVGPSQVRNGSKYKPFLSLCKGGLAFITRKDDGVVNAITCINLHV